MTPLLGLLAVAALVAATGFFVAAEFGLVAARRPVIEERAAAGNRRARAALHEMRNVSFMLSGAQLGITATTLVLGYIAEPAFASLLGPVIRLFNLPESSVLAVSLGGALIISTVLSMVVGELAPKNLAVARPEETALAVAIPMRLYSFVFRPFIWFFDTTASWLSRSVATEPPEELLGAYTPEELARIIEASSEEGALGQEKAKLLLRAVELGERRVNEIMIPGPDIVWLSADDPVSSLREVARGTGFSRFPVRGESQDDLVGTVHIKDLLRLASDEVDTAAVGDIAQEALVVPESHTLRRLLSDLRSHHRTFAVVVDEFGGTAGIVTLEDVLEALVGDIADEFDPDTPVLRRLGAGRYVLPGRMRTGRVEELLGTQLRDGDFETLAGFIIDRLGHIPRPGEWIRHDDWRFVVLGLDGNRIAEVLLERPGEELPASTAPGAVARSDVDERSAGGDMAGREPA